MENKEQIIDFNLTISITQAKYTKWSKYPIRDGIVRLDFLKKGLNYVL